VCSGRLDGDAARAAADDPLVSVIVASYDARETIGATLESLLRQETSVPYEVIVVDSSTDGTADLVADAYPRVRLLRSPTRLFPGGARNVGVREARGSILAFTDADCVADPEFVRAIAEAHRAQAPLIAGVIANGNPESRIGWVHYFSEFSSWMPQRGARSVRDLPSAALSVKRWAFERHGPFQERGYCSDTAFSWRVRSAGHDPWFDPSIRVEHTHITDLRRLLRKLVFHGRSFAAVRMTQGGFGPGRRILHALGSPALPFLLLARTAGRVLRSGAYRREFARTFPLVFLGLAAWSLGEAVGYVEGPGRPVESPA
jgi:glycosyltransferase involved in cell wall biosynthesis